MPTTRTTTSPDTACAAAVDLARAAAVEMAGPEGVGDHVGVEAEGERLVTHAFTAKALGYRGWRWAVTVSRIPRSRTCTVSEVVLLPGSEAVLAPAWVPWSDRLAPGDLGARDVLAFRADDPLLQPGYEATDDEEADRLALWDLGLGRPRVLSPQGRDEAARRWYEGQHGPRADVAVHARAACATCGYLIQLTGSLRSVFGVCANAWSPSDGAVVSLDHGCGAHSETDLEQVDLEPLPPLILDETRYEPVAIRAGRRPAEAGPGEDESGDADSEAMTPEQAGDVAAPEDELGPGSAVAGDPVRDGDADPAAP